jgi:hypothetical protein
MGTQYIDISKKIDISKAKEMGMVVFFMSQYYTRNWSGLNYWLSPIIILIKINFLQSANNLCTGC